MSESTVGLLDPVAHRVRAHVVGLVYWIVLPLLAIAVLVGGSWTTAHRIHAEPVGVKGTYTVTDRSCFGDVCQNSGSFVATNGTLKFGTVLGDPRWKVGQVHTVVLDPQSEVIALPAKWDPVATLSGCVGALIFLGVWTYFLVSGLRARRRAP